MISITAGSANELFSRACAAVRAEGMVVRPRGMGTREILGAHLCLRDPRRRLVDLPPARVINPAFAVAEALWILSGSDDPWIFQYNLGLSRYADDGRLQGAYGPRLRGWAARAESRVQDRADGRVEDRGDGRVGGRVDQLDHVRQLLGRDPDTRQAVIQLFDPDRDTRGHRDVPCTLGYRFFLRAGRLHMHTTMRSQDLWLGFPYDVFATTLLQELLAGWLQVDLGEYHHHVDSLHLYDQHLDLAAALPPAPAPSPVMPAVAVDWEELQPRLTAVITGTPGLKKTSAWGEFAAVLGSYRDWADGRRDLARTTAASAPGELGAALQRWYRRLDAAEHRGAGRDLADAGNRAAPAVGVPEGDVPANAFSGDGSPG